MDNFGLRFDVDGFIHDLEKKLRYVVEEVVDMTIGRVKAYGLDEFVWKKIVESEAEAKVRVTLGTEQWGALLKNYGKGSLMSLDNPFLYKYIGSEYWNPAREGTAVVTRPKGKYVVPDWHGTGERIIDSQGPGGLPLEDRGGAFAPYRGNRALERAMEDAKGLLDKGLYEAFSQWDISVYLKGGGR